MFHKEVHIIDAIVAVILVEASLQGDSSLLSLNDMNGEFPENPTVFQNILNFIVLEKLDLLRLLETSGVEKTDNQKGNTQQQHLISLNEDEVLQSNERNVETNVTYTEEEEEEEGGKQNETVSLDKDETTCVKGFFSKEKNDEEDKTIKNVELNRFRFKPRDVAMEYNASEKKLDINEMLNMIPSAATDFDIDDDLVLEDISQQSIDSDDN